MSAPSTPPLPREACSSTVQPQRAPSSILASPAGAARADDAHAGSSQQGAGAGGGSGSGSANVHYGRDALFASPSKGSAAAANAASRSRHESTGSNADGGLAAPPRAAHAGLGDKAGRASNLSLGGSTSYASSAAGESAQARSLRNSTARRSRVQTRPGEWRCPGERRRAPPC